MSKLHLIVRVFNDRISTVKWNRANARTSSGKDQKAIEVDLGIKTPDWLVANCACQAANANKRLGNSDHAKKLYRDAIRFERNERPKQKRQSSEFISANAKFFRKSISYGQPKEASYDKLLQALKSLKKSSSASGQ